MPRWNDDFDRFYPTSIPLPAKGGIRAQSRRGTFANSWWGRRWLETLESFQLHSRLARGRSYARRGQVMQLEIAEQKVTATVQGSRPQPYIVTIALKRIPLVHWHKVVRKLATRIAIAARLIARELPEEVEQYFREAGVPLFPARKDDLITACSCPDSSNPCKHVAAVYYLLAEQFDHDPFFLLNLRGIGRQEFAAVLGGPQAASEMGESAASEPASPLTSDLEVFWRAGRLPQIHSGDTTITEQSAPLARRLGNLPFWRGQTDFLEALATMSRGASEGAVSLLLRLNL
jgi:uncharacterized Zn finger protein